MDSSTHWLEKAAQLDFAFQPIVNIHSGACFAVEALLRGTDRLGYATIQELFDEACDGLWLFPLEMTLRRMALEKFARLGFHRAIKLFYNIDNRVVQMPDYRHMAHVPGTLVIAEGVETEEEFFVCRDAGCNFVQGYLVQRPVTDLGQILPLYKHLAELNSRGRRLDVPSRRLRLANIDRIEPSRVADPVSG
jgi:EAL domain-containing protein (putative c-di-GMP-specific phosphodiesterase class I)